MDKIKPEKLFFRLSPSSLNLMKECPRCFWLEKHNVWKRPQGIFPSLPSGMDRIFKVHFDRFMEKDELPPEICNHVYCEGMTLFKDKELLRTWQNNRKGISWQDGKGNILYGAIDNLLQKGDKLIVLDYKTRGFDLKEDTSEHYQDQLDLYNFLLRKNGYKTEDFAFLLFYVPEKVTETGQVVFNAILKKVDIDVKNAEEIFERAIALLESECPEKGCEWCHRL